MKDIAEYIINNLGILITFAWVSTSIICILILKSVINIENKINKIYEKIVSDKESTENESEKD